MRIESKCVHSGSYRDDATGGINTPIFTSSAYNYLDREETIYPRYFNTPNQRAVVSKLCTLEGGDDGVLFGSGMAAMSTAILAFAGTGEHVVLMDELYGGTHAFVTDTFDRLGIAYSFAATDAAAVVDAINARTRVIVIESPTNPLLGVIDIRAVAEAARAQGVVTIIDNTFASPINQTPLDLGIDIVVHSGTKYLAGHSDLCCGVAVSSRENAARILHLARHLGGSLNATDSYLLERSLKTLALRVERQTRNAQQLAEHLERHPKISRVFYPGLASFAGHELARRQMNLFGAMLSFEPGGTPHAAERFVRSLRLINPAVSLGGVETTIRAWDVLAGAQMSPAERARIGVRDSLLRLSVGIEHVDDLVADLDQALGEI